MGAAKGGSRCVSCQRHLQRSEQQPAATGHTKISYSQSPDTGRTGLPLRISFCEGLRASRAGSEAKPGTTRLLLAEHNGARTLLRGNLERRSAGRGRTGFKRLRLQLPLGIRTTAASEPTWLAICENKHQNAWAGRKYVPN